MIVEDEQEGEKRAKYGKAQLQTISRELTKEFGRVFDVANLRNMRRFYITFPIWETLIMSLAKITKIKIVFIPKMAKYQRL